MSDFSDPVVRFAADAYKQLEIIGEAGNTLNLLPDLEWRIRESIRTVEGKVERVTDALVELVDKIGSDESENLLEEWYPEEDA